MRDLQNNKVLDSKGKPIMTRVYQFTRANGSKVLIQDHSAGHNFSSLDGKGDQKAHFNLRPIEKPRNGKLDEAKAHYYFKEKK